MEKTQNNIDTLAEEWIEISDKLVKLDLVLENQNKNQTQN